jgi:hypothetical protein
VQGRHRAHAQGGSEVRKLKTRRRIVVKPGHCAFRASRVSAWRSVKSGRGCPSSADTPAHRPRGTWRGATRPLAYISCALWVLAALALARMMVWRNQIKAVYVVEQDTDTWTNEARRLNRSFQCDAKRAATTRAGAARATYG